MLYGRNSVGLIVKMLREEYEIETDPKMVQQIMNPAKVRTLNPKPQTPTLNLFPKPNL